MISLGSISRRPWPAILLVAISVAVTAPRARAIIINGEGPDGVTGIYDRFNVGTYPGAPVPNPAFIGAALDLSGIGWMAADSTRSITLVSSQYFVVASHYAPASGSVLQFLGTDHLLHSATVGSYYTLTYMGTGGAQSSDLTVGRLTTALPSSVNPLPIYYRGTTNVSTPSSFDQYIGLSLFNYGRTARMGTNILDDFSEFSFSTGPATNIGLVYDHDADAGETLLESGDSGSPTLAYMDGILGLIGTHSGVDGPYSVDAFVAYTPYVDQINAILANDFQMLAFVPEPGTTLLGLLVLGMSGALRMRKRAVGELKSQG